MKCWLLKTEPSDFSFTDLLEAPRQTALWDGVRNYQARNFLREARRGDKVLIYHSSVTPPHVAGIAQVVRESYPDPTQFDPEAPHYDPKATQSAPRWDAVDIRAVAALPRNVPIEALRQDPGLAQLPLLKRGNRLSVMPLSATEFQRILELAHLEDV